MLKVLQGVFISIFFISAQALAGGMAAGNPNLSMNPSYNDELKIDVYDKNDIDFDLLEFIGYTNYDNQVLEVYIDLETDEVIFVF